MSNAPERTTLDEVEAVLLPRQWAGACEALDSFDRATDDDMPDGAWGALLADYAGQYLRRSLPKIALAKMRKAHLDGHDLWIAWMEQRARDTAVIEQMEGK